MDAHDNMKWISIHLTVGILIQICQINDPDYTSQSVRAPKPHLITLTNRPMTGSASQKRLCQLLDPTAAAVRCAQILPMVLGNPGIVLGSSKNMSAVKF